MGARALRIPEHPHNINVTSNLHVDGGRVATTTQKAIAAELEMPRRGEQLE
jgi:hypothetical protein